MMASQPDETGDGGEAQEVIPVDDRQFAELIAEQRERNAIVARALEIDREEAQAGKAEKLLIGIILLLGGASLRDLMGRVQKRLINR
jgi:hypothetical protein